MRKMLCLDLATTTGWACAPVDVASVSEIRHGTKTMPKTGDDIGRFLFDYDEWLNAMIDVEDPAIIVYEAPILSSGKTTPATARKLMGLGSHTEFVCESRGVMVREINLATVKKSFAGHGHADKEQMVAAAERAGFVVKDDNDADACALWATALKIYKPVEHRRLFDRGLFGGAR